MGKVCIMLPIGPGIPYQHDSLTYCGRFNGFLMDLKHAVGCIEREAWVRTFSARNA